MSLLLVQLLVPAAFAGKTRRLRFERIRVGNEVLSDINSILQDREGFMWIGSQTGLKRFDGYRFWNFTSTDEPGSISNDWISALIEASDGHLWVGTYGGGLNRFDPTTEVFEHFRNDPDNPNSLSHKNVWCLLESQDGTLWVGTQRGLNKYNPETGGFTRFRTGPDPALSVSNNNIKSLCEGSDGALWIGTWGGGLNRLDPKTGRFTHFRHDAADPNSISSNHVNNLLAAPDGGIWIGHGNRGVDRLDPKTGELVNFKMDRDNPWSITGNRIRKIAMDRGQNIWIATHAGLNLYIPELNGFRTYQHKPFDSSSLSQNDILSFFEDRSGVIWVGTYSGGLNISKPVNPGFENWTKDPQLKNISLSHENVRALFEDRDGIVWVGTEGGGVNRLDRDTRIAKHYRHDPKDKNSLSHDHVWCFNQTQDGALWVGTLRGLDRFDPQTETFTRYHADLNDPKGLSDGDIHAILPTEEQDGLWLATFGGGLDYLNLKTGRVRRHRHDPDNPLTISSNTVYSLAVSKRPGFWVGTIGNGFNWFSPNTGEFRRYTANDDLDNTVSHDWVGSMTETADGILWVATFGGGLDRYDPTTDTFTNYFKSGILPDKVVYAVLEDENHTLWISTNQGIAHLDPRTDEIKIYDYWDGLQHWEFNGGAFFKSQSGEMFFGGIQGFNAFYPGNLKRPPTSPPAVTLTDFLILNKSVKPGTEPEHPLQKPIIHADEVILTHDDYVFSFEFASLDYANSQKNQYAYKLEGLDREWIMTDANRRFATYTRLQPGDYVFKVKGSNKDGVWNDKGVSIRVKVVPPFWQTHWAYALYSILLIGFVRRYMVVRDREQHLKLERAREDYQRELMVAQQLRRADRLKDEFLANTSHELRTPLTGIIGIVESLLDGASGDLSQPTRENLSMVRSCAIRLSTHVNDILDFSKLKNNSIQLQLKNVDARTLTDIVLFTSMPMAKHKHLALRNEISPNLPAVCADENRLLQILHNLIGNAVKFTEEGAVTVSAERDGDFIRFNVSDTGIGIARDRQLQIFQPFEQADGSVERDFGGTGLGLAITRQLVQLHQGEIHVVSTPGKGSVFSFTLRVADGPAEATRSAPVALNRIQPAPKAVVEEQGENREATILLVDDEPVILQVLTNYLTQHGYKTVQATGGAQALELIFSDHHHFDLVLLDIMMPKLSGYDVCRRIREKFSARELPVIFLTARTQTNDMAQAFEDGANDYLVKPFTKSEVLPRIQTHLKMADLASHLARAEMQVKTDVTANEQIRAGNSVLHNVGNILTSIVISCEMLEMRMDTSRIPEMRNLLSRMSELPAMPDPIEELTTTGKSVAEEFSLIHKELHQIVKRTYLMKDLINVYQSYGKRSCTRLESVSLGTLVEDSLLVQREFLIRHAVKVETVLVEDLWVSASKIHIMHVLINLLKNAAEAMESLPDQDKRIVVESGVMAGNKVFVRVRDNGMGMSSEVLDQLFSYGFTTKKAGHGYGLPYCAMVMKDMGGGISAESEGSGKGSVFTLTFREDINVASVTAGAFDTEHAMTGTH